MSSLQFSRYILALVFLFVSLAAGFLSVQYCNHLRKSERLNLFEYRNQLEDTLSQRIQEYWQNTLMSTIDSTRRTIPSSKDHISKALKVLVASQEEIMQAFYLDQETIYLPQWKKFRFVKGREDLDLSLLENPDFKQAEISEYQYQDFESAVTVYERFWLENPDNLQAAAALARCLYKQGKFTRAEKIYRQIYTQNPALQMQGGVPLAITAAFQLLNVLDAQGNSESVKTFALDLYQDFLDEKWELAQNKNTFYKKKIQTALQPHLADAGLAKRLQQLLTREKELEATKQYVRFISKSVIPFIEGSMIGDYRIYFLSAQSREPHFLLIIPDGPNYIVLDIVYRTYVEQRLLPFLKTTAQDNQLGLRVQYAGVDQTPVPPLDGTSFTFSLSKDFPDLNATFTFPADLERALSRHFSKIKTYFISGYTGFVLLLALIYFVLIKQIQFAELKSDFVSHVSHELKTPLTSLRMFSEMLKSKPHLSLQKRRQYYDIMLEESIRLSRLIENLLDISRIERKKGQYVLKPENLNHVLRAAIDVFSSTIITGEYKIKCQLHTNVTVCLDRNAVIQMVINLLDNARKFSPVKSTLSVSSVVQENKAILSIEDHGIGMSPRDVRKVFKKFYQVKKAYADNFKGVGLGLAIVKNIVQAHQAKITLTSKLHRGTKVSVAFPISPANP